MPQTCFYQYYQLLYQIEPLADITYIYIGNTYLSLYKLEELIFCVPGSGWVNGFN